MFFSRKFLQEALAGDIAFPIWGQVCWVSSLLINQNTSEHEHSHQILFILCFNYQHSPWHIFSCQQPAPTQTIPMLGSGDGKNNSHQALWATLFWMWGQSVAVNRIKLGLAADFWAQGPKLPQICAEEKEIFLVALQSRQQNSLGFPFQLPSFSEYFSPHLQDHNILSVFGGQIFVLLSGWGSHLN